MKKGIKDEEREGERERDGERERRNNRPPAQKVVLSIVPDWNQAVLIHLADESHTR